jgi:hypothetical protein
MIGILWNCRGVSKKGMGIDIRNLINEVTVDFIGLQETMRKKYNEKFFRVVDPNRSFAGTGCPQKAGLEGSFVESEKKILTLLKLLNMSLQ